MQRTEQNEQQSTKVKFIRLLAKYKNVVHIAAMSNSNAFVLISIFIYFLNTSGRCWQARNHTNPAGLYTAT